MFTLMYIALIAALHYVLFMFTPVYIATSVLTCKFWISTFLHVAIYSNALTLRVTFLVTITPMNIALTSVLTYIFLI